MNIEEIRKNAPKGYRFYVLWIDGDISYCNLMGDFSVEFQSGKRLSARYIRDFCIEIKPLH